MSRQEAGHARRSARSGVTREVDGAARAGRPVGDAERAVPHRTTGVVALVGAVPDRGPGGVAAAQSSPASIADADVAGADARDPRRPRIWLGRRADRGRDRRGPWHGAARAGADGPQSAPERAAPAGAAV